MIALLLAAVSRLDDGRVGSAVSGRRHGVRRVRAETQALAYEDFHGDGSYATNTSKGPRSGAWTWSGTYDTARSVTHGSVIWRRTNAGSIDRTFQYTVDGVPHEAHDSCTRH